MIVTSHTGNWKVSFVPIFDEKLLYYTNVKEYVKINITHNKINVSL